MRIVIQWPKEPRKGYPPGCATAVIVFQIDNPQEVAFHLHYIERYDAYSHGGEGFKVVLARNERTFTKITCGCFMAAVWKQGQRFEMEDRKNFKEAHKLRQEERWGCFWNAPL